MHAPRITRGIPCYQMPPKSSRMQSDTHCPDCGRGNEHSLITALLTQTTRRPVSQNNQHQHRPIRANVILHPQESERTETSAVNSRLALRPRRSARMTAQHAHTQEQKGSKLSPRNILQPSQPRRQSSSSSKAPTTSNSCGGSPRC